MRIKILMIYFINVNYFHECNTSIMQWISFMCALLFRHSLVLCVSSITTEDNLDAGDASLYKHDRMLQIIFISTM